MRNEYKDNKIKNIITVVLLIVVLLTSCKSGNTNYNADIIEIKYDINDIKTKLIKNYEETYDFKAISDITLPFFNSILFKVDSLVGEDNYYIESIYYVEQIGRYVVKIIPKDYLMDYNNWNKNSAKNPYKVLFSLGTNGKVDNYYETFVLAEEWQKEVTEEFKDRYNKYHLNIRYNQLRYISALNIRRTSSWNDALGNFSFNRLDMNYINIFVPHDTAEEEIKHLIADMQSFLKKYYIKAVHVCILAENSTYSLIESSESITGNYYFESMSKDIDEIFIFYIDREGAIRN